MCFTLNGKRRSPILDPHALGRLMAQFADTSTYLSRAFRTGSTCIQGTVVGPGIETVLHKDSGQNIAPHARAHLQTFPTEPWERF